MNTAGRVDKSKEAVFNIADGAHRVQTVRRGIAATKGGRIMALGFKSFQVNTSNYARTISTIYYRYF